VKANAVADPLDRAVLALMRQAAERIILPRYRKLKTGEIDDKGGGDPVTIADREAEELLAEGLAALDPAPAIVGEEAAHRSPPSPETLAGACWIIDPLDGTRNFAAGKPPFGIIIARADGGEAEAGWLYDCLTGRLCHARRGTGAFIDGEPISSRPSTRIPPVAALSLVFLDAQRREKVRRHIAPHYQLVDIPYCAAEQYPRLALGVNDVSLFERTLCWDHAAGVLWLNEAGGKALRPDGSSYCVDEPDRTGLLAAASPALWDELAARYAALA
jgi:fructose-1,6-bisphosphatase/inositol monophosphatase family enzyme